MRYDNQVLFDKGLVGMAYQLEAMMDKAPELSDDFDNLNTLIADIMEDLETKETDAFDSGYTDGYSQAEWDLGGKYDEGYEDGKQEGYEEGYSEGLEEGQSSLV